ncbi:SAM-dependent methyltransferase [Microvirga pakistanensis]|uniref:SAM-dependent methyltransferase n=1 Tax=Microvirga pakistanensis TaxID=1682650 RepID=UPI00106CD065|nr:SAM-dependent methyltransferase [Microvirga pakistanensis]
MYDDHLLVVGTGIRTTGQLTVETVACMQCAARIFYIVADPVAEEVIRRFCPDGAESLYGLYGEGKPRMQTYQEMVDRILTSVRTGERTVAAFYGHPGVFAYASHESIRRARAEGYRARMLPGISAEDCLFADLGIDPSSNGCQSYEATDFLLNARSIDNSSQLILWQAGLIGDLTFRRYAYDTSAMPLLLEKLLLSYPRTHPVYLYEAPSAPGCEPVIRPIVLEQLLTSGITATTTLYLPPARATVPDPTYLSRIRLQQG